MPPPLSPQETHFQNDILISFPSPSISFSKKTVLFPSLFSKKILRQTYYLPNLRFHPKKKKKIPILSLPFSHIHHTHTHPRSITMQIKKNSRYDWATFHPGPPCQGCNHRFGLLKSNTVLIFWICQLCHSGPHMHIFQCFLCRRKVCRGCTSKN